jgi:hypothetical protein
MEYKQREYPLFSACSLNCEQRNISLKLRNKTR